MMAATDRQPSIAILPPLSMPTAADEVNHRVANHLQLVAALIAAETRGVSDPETKAVLERTQQRIAAVGRVHRQLYLTGDADIDLGAYLEDLGEQLSLSCPAHRRIMVDAQSALVSGSTASAIGILATELVTNACKHAYAVDERGDILVGLCRLPDGSHRFIVEDRGRGNPGHTAGSGLGTRLIEATVAKLGACAAVECLFPGTRFCMNLRF